MYGVKLLAGLLLAPAFLAIVSLEILPVGGASPTSAGASEQLASVNTTSQLTQELPPRLTLDWTPQETSTSQQVVVPGPGLRAKCTRQSTVLARQTLLNELESINKFGPSSWLVDLDKDEMLEAQKLSLASVLLAGDHLASSLGDSLRGGPVRPLLELESSYFRSANSALQRPLADTNGHMTSSIIKLTRQHQNRCHLAQDKGVFVYTFGLTLGPIEHHLDFQYNYPRELRLHQPSDWSYAQLLVQVPKMHYEVTLTQTANHKLNEGCAIELRDVTYLARTTGGGGGGGDGLEAQQVSVNGHGLAPSNQTALHVVRLFNDFTRPIVSKRLRQLLRLTLAGKTLPLASVELP